MKNFDKTLSAICDVDISSGILPKTERAFSNMKAALDNVFETLLLESGEEFSEEEKETLLNSLEDDIKVAMLNITSKY